MTEITLNIKNSKVRFFMELIGYFDFVEVVQKDDHEPAKKEIKKTSDREGT
jgi:hypothetical protein